MLDQHWKRYRRRNRRGRDYATARIACAIFLSFFAGGCRSNWPSLYADARNNFEHSRLRGDQTEAAEAASLADKCLHSSAQSDPVWSYKFRVLEAEIIVLKHPDKALELLKPAPPPELISGEFAGRRKIFQGLAYALRQDYKNATLALHEAAPIVAGNNELMTLVLLDQAYVFHVQNQTREAADQYNAAIALAHKYGLDYWEANARLRLGKILMDRETYDQAIDQFNPALRLVHSIRAPALEHIALGDLGWSYLQIGDLENSATVLNKAAEIAANVKDDESEELWLRDLGILFLNQNDYPRAESYFEKSLPVARKLGDKERISINYHNLAQLELKRGRVDKAESYNKLAYAAKGLGPQDLSDRYLLLTSAEIAAYRKDFPKAEDYLNAVIHHPNSDISLRWQALSDLANLHVVKGDNAKADAFFFQALQLIETAREEVKQEDRRLSILDAWPFYDDYIRFLAHEGNDAKALQIAEFSRGRTLAEAFGIGDPQKAAGLQIPVIKSFLRKRNQAILAYWISEQESYLWVITPTKFKLTRLADKQSIEREVEAYTREIREHEETANSAHGQKLYEMLVQPAQAMLPRNPKVIIVPNRSLYKLNFETLVVPGKDPHYWIEDAVVENASSIALLAQAKNRRVQGLKKLLLIGAPVQVSDEFPALRFADDEIKSVEGHFPRDQETVLADKDATPVAYSAAHPGEYRFIHLVTHGIPSQTSPLDSAIILSSGPDKSFKLYARDIKDIGPLHADLVTISACYGAGEKAYAGEGLVGLAWAFMRAGSHQVIAALWEVGDATMPKVMDHFYAELQSGKSIPEALRLAKLTVVHSNDFHKRPYYWASLQLYTGP